MSKSQTLADFFGVDEVTFKNTNPKDIIASTAHLIIDVQRFYADPNYLPDPENPDAFKGGDEYTEEKTDNIVGLIPKFRDAGLQIYHVYSRKNSKDTPEESYGGWYKVQPDPETDEILKKTQSSAFKYTDLTKTLHDNGVKNLIVSGFNTNTCIYESVMDALSREFNVCIAYDTVDNGAGWHGTDQTEIREMKEAGAVISDSDKILEVLHQLNEPS